MNHRRSFLKKSVSILGGAFTASSLYNELHAHSFDLAKQMLDDAGGGDSDVANEDFWNLIRDAYTTNPNIINLNNGGVSPAPRVVQAALQRYNDQANQGPSYYMWRIIDQGREPLRKKLADLAGADAEEIAINRNATEAINTIVYGLPLQRGDEVIGTKQDYPNMVQAWKQRQQREGIVYNQISFDFPLEDEAAIVRKYQEAITPNTKLIHVTHIINWVGQIMPVKKIADMAHKQGIEVLVDGAHSFGLLDFKVPQLGADYFGTSLHKFLSAPIGSGMLYVKRDKIEKIWPLLCNDKPLSMDIRKFETLGTRSFCIEQAIGEAINFHEGIGAKRKENRIRYLKNYWVERVKHLPKVRIHTSTKPKYSCAIAGLSIDGVKPEEVDLRLFNEFKIHTVAIHWENIHCVRITPHVYTRTKDLDKLVLAIEHIAKG